ncbi:MAG: hypothetical protein GY944_08605 [bacterium]|nr:hypothetical protein [bacterium]
MALIDRIFDGECPLQHIYGIGLLRAANNPLCPTRQVAIRKLGIRPTEVADFQTILDRIVATPAEVEGIVWLMGARGRAPNNQGVGAHILTHEEVATELGITAPERPPGVPSR